jgi:hypothetical protein
MNRRAQLVTALGDTGTESLRSCAKRGDKSSRRGPDFDRSGNGPMPDNDRSRTMRCYKLAREHTLRWRDRTS